jgi:hypothetical protein
MNAARPEQPEAPKQRDRRDAVWSFMPSWIRFAIVVDGRDGRDRAVLGDPADTNRIFAELLPNAVPGFGTLVEVQLAGVSH